MNQQQSQSNDPNGSNGLAKMFLVCRALAITLEVFLHKANSFGERYLGAQAAVALLLVFFFPVFWPQADPAPLAVFGGAFLVRCAMVGASTRLRRARGGPQPHSFYTGQSVLMTSKSKIPETQIKGILEPVLVGFIGLVLQDWNEPLGTFLLLAALALFLTVLLSVRQDRTRALDMNDAISEQRRIAEQWRGMRRD